MKMRKKDESVIKLLEEKKEKIAHIIQTARVQKGLTQAEIGNRVGMSQNTIARIENARFFPELKSLILILESLEIPLIIGDDEIIQKKKANSNK